MTTKRKPINLWTPPHGADAAGRPVPIVDNAEAIELIRAGLLNELYTRGWPLLLRLIAKSRRQGWARGLDRRELGYVCERALHTACEQIDGSIENPAGWLRAVAAREALQSVRPRRRRRRVETESESTTSGDWLANQQSTRRGRAPEPMGLNDLPARSDCGDDDPVNPENHLCWVRICLCCVDEVDHRIVQYMRANYGKPLTCGQIERDLSLPADVIYRRQRELCAKYRSLSGYRDRSPKNRPEFPEDQSNPGSLAPHNVWGKAAANRSADQYDLAT